MERLSSLSGSCIDGHNTVCKLLVVPSVYNIPSRWSCCPSPAAGYHRRCGLGKEATYSFAKVDSARKVKRSSAPSLPTHQLQSPSVEAEPSLRSPPFLSIPPIAQRGSLLPALLVHDGIAQSSQLRILLHVLTCRDDLRWFVCYFYVLQLCSLR